MLGALRYEWKEDAEAKSTQLFHVLMYFLPEYFYDVQAG